MKQLVTRDANFVPVHTRVLKLYIKEIHAYVGLSDDDRIILILCRVPKMKVL